MVMKALYDTSVLTAGLVSQHPEHERCWQRLEAARTGKVQGFVASHSIAELFGTLTRLPLRPRITSFEAALQIRHHLFASYEIVPLSPEHYLEVVERLASQGLAGGIVYDALIGRAAELAGVDALLTLNRRDFDRLGLTVEIREP